MFEQLGYFKEYYVNDKFIGSINCKKDRDVIGYLGKKTEVCEETITLDNNKKIKKGTSAVTFLYPLCGKKIN